jgi:uncharacterized membrane protein
LIAAGSPGRSVTTSGRAPAGAVYILFMVAPFTGGLTALIGWLVGKASKGGADGPALQHLRRQGRLFWTALLWAIPIALLAFVGWLTRIVLIGYPLGWIAAAAGFVLSAWFVLTSLFGLLRLQSDRPPRG